MQANWLSARNNHTYENGRRYHGYKPEFPFPDDQEAKTDHSSLCGIWSEILDGKHFFLAPLPQTGLKKNHKVLDFATRSGDWAHDFYRSEQHSKAKITAMDPIYMQRFEGRKFLHHTLEGDWPFSAKRAFHFIHAESLGGVVVDFEGFHSNSYKHLVPGRWLEVRENDIRPFCSDDDDHHDGGEVLGLQAPALKQWQELLAQAAEKFGKRINVAWMQRELMERAGFIKVKEQVFKVPLGEWSENPKWKSIGRHYWYQFSRALEGYSLPLFTGTLGWSKEDTDAFLARVREELQQQKDNLRLYSYFHVVAGQKPVNNAGR